MKKVYICWYHYWDNSEYEGVCDDDFIYGVFDSEEKAKRFVMDCAVEYVEGLINGMKNSSYRPEYAQAEITRLEALKNDLSFDEQGKNVCICDDYENRCWAYEDHEVK